MSAVNVSFIFGPKLSEENTKLLQSIVYFLSIAIKSIYMNAFFYLFKRDWAPNERAYTSLAMHFLKLCTVW